MGYVQRSAADEDSGGAVLFLLKAPLLHHQAERSIQTERGRETMARAMWRQRLTVAQGAFTSSDVDRSYGFSNHNKFGVR